MSRIKSKINIFRNSVEKKFNQQAPTLTNTSKKLYKNAVASKGKHMIRKER